MRGVILRLVCAYFLGMTAAVAAAQTASPPAAAGAAPTANRLARESSPYLRQHAHNPVDWYPWGPEALAAARRENKLLFLSIGYSSCHWCHVMERESFQDAEIAAVLNRHYICVKVDREEHPEIDNIYMTAVMLVQGRGGWPLSIFLTPDARPFFGGTYFPARDGDRGRATGFLTIASRIQEIWENEPERITADAEKLTRLVKAELETRAQAERQPAGPELLDDVQAALAREFDPEYGGFGYAADEPQRPKFPEPSNLAFLWSRAMDDRLAETVRAEARQLALVTLEKMAGGGIYDQLGGGFHRYSVDRFWRIPHFEKMLYDNAQLVSLYALAYQQSGRDDFRRVVEETLAFVARELTAPGGGFYAALDADSEGEEGAYYRWQRRQIADLLPREEFPLFAAAYGLTGEPNFEAAYYVLECRTPLEKLAEQFSLPVTDLRPRLDTLRARLLTERARRPRPRTDDKILTAWNGLMIRGYADAGRLLKQPQYVQAAERAADFLLTHLRTAEGRLLRTYAQGQAKLPGHLDDYAFLIDGLLGLQEATGDEKWLVAAEQLAERQHQDFWDEQQGGFFFTATDATNLLARARDPYDSVMPSGNSVSAHNLLRLARLRARDDFRRQAETTITGVTGILARQPGAAPRMALVIGQFLRDAR